MSGESFLSRWSRRKQAAPAQVQAEDRRQAREQSADQTIAAVAAPAPAAAGAPTDPPPDLPPIDSLTPQADFRPFMQVQVPAALKNAALKKLFADPHFNVMDGLDTYIDDYTRSEPIPLDMMRKLAQSRALKLFDYSAEEAAEKLALEQEQARRTDAAAPPLAVAAATAPPPSPRATAHGSDDRERTLPAAGADGAAP
jgi:Protein of unknown function (DUF3306)